ncbi:GNAT family N-acetyltransferase [Pseudomonas sp. HMWF032]|uniref:GNAT family N-acetyltransferase n=1 Tax=Pseudomonas sp. HMWF032 TaxID=2056866 RepID=UPI000D3821CF|nr:GNAT family N-acetyltransferase [Pseudomonas sp. HMWF032]PTS85264.1 GNAT family N-acetyltransferase [Pseudomonas sp. HMWF032]PTT84728.1 GNAT family N-acetyltransferase [Pseudomonas sp. HMWF010]
MLSIERLDAADFESYRQGLLALLLDSVAHGASVGFLAGLDADAANLYFDQVLAGIRDGTHLLWLACEQGQVLGSVQLVLCQKPNGLNRAEVQKLLVHSNARRRGIANSLMQRLEGEAAELQRGLLYLDTEAGSDAETFYQALGYSCIGGLPDYACGPDGQYRANAIYYKTLSRPQP